MNDQQPPKGFNHVVGRNIAAARKARGWSQGDLAAMLGLRGLSFQQQTVLKVEKGSRPLRFEEAVQIADLLELDVNDLVRDEDSQVMLARERLLAARRRLESAQLQVTKAQLDLGRAQEWVSEMEDSFEEYLNSEQAERDAAEAAERYEQERAESGD